jgi:anti-anti-sigma factor
VHTLFTYEIIQQISKTIVLFSGDLDIDATEIIEDQLTQELIKCEEVELNFEAVPFVDSSGIGLLISLIDHIREAGIPVLVTHVSEDVQTVFSLLQLPEILGKDVFEDFK